MNLRSIVLAHICWLTFGVGVVAAPALLPIDEGAEVNQQFVEVEALRQTLIYKQVGFKELHLDLYRQKSPARPQPVVVYVHGGGWIGGSKRDAARWRTAPIINKLVANGFVAASIDYSRGPTIVSIEEQIDDVRDCLRFLERHASELCIKSEGYALWGASAGAHLALMAASGFSAEGAPPLREGLVSKVLAWYPATDLRRMLRENQEAAPRRLAALGPPEVDDKDRWRQLSPIAHADSFTIPILLVHGTEDRILTIAQSEAFLEALGARGQGSLIRVEGGVHGFLTAPGERVLSPSLGEIVDRSVQFLQDGIQPSQVSGSSSFSEIR